jgi:hypothetical protein
MKMRNKPAEVRSAIHPKSPIIAGHFNLVANGNGSFDGYIDIGEDRISCRLSPQGDQTILKLETYVQELPLGTGKPFHIGAPN